MIIKKYVTIFVSGLYFYPSNPIKQVRQHDVIIRKKDVTAKHGGNSTAYNKLLYYCTWHLLLKITTSRCKQREQKT